MSNFMDVLDTILVADEAQLSQIEQAVKQRKEIVLSRMVLDLKPKDIVRFNSKTRPKYLVGLEAEVTKVNQKTVGVKIVEGDVFKARRYGKSAFRCPISLIEV